MTKKELENANALCEAATAGPWDSEGTNYVFANVPGGRPNGEGIAVFGCYTNRKATEPYADAAFTAASRELVPKLIAEVEESWKLLKNVYIKLMNGLDIDEKQIRAFIDKKD